MNKIIQDMTDQHEDYGIVLQVGSDHGTELYTFTYWPEDGERGEFKPLFIDGRELTLLECVRVSDEAARLLGISLMETFSGTTPKQ
ncbi:MAG: hypothetical protein M3Y33_00505 [Actinomycetota bacterium]|nr:hypothetical protein [Actinomycetota bacterium]